MLSKTMEDKLYQMRLELQNERKAREEAEEARNRGVSDNIMVLANSLEAVKANRETLGSKLVGQMKQEVSQLHEVLKQEKHVRHPSYPLSNVNLALADSVRLLFVCVFFSSDAGGNREHNAENA